MGKAKKNYTEQVKKQVSITRDLYIDNIRSVEENERQFILSFSSEEPYDRGYYTEILDHSEGSIDLTRIKEIGCVLFNHNRDFVIGKIIDAWVENSRGYAKIEFDTDEESDKIYQKVKSGTLKGVSVGYRIMVWEEVTANKVSTDGRFTGPVDIAKKWFPYEISIVSVPADATVGVGRDLQDDEHKDIGSLSLYERQIQINKNYI